MITTDEIPSEEDLLVLGNGTEDMRVQLARIEQRINDHEEHDKHFRQIAMWVSGMFVAVLVATVGTMWGDISRIDGRQQVVLSTVSEIRGQLADIKDDIKLIRADFKQHIERTNGDK